MATHDPKPVKKSKPAPEKTSGKAAGSSKKQEDDLLEEALEETFPASDPMSSMHFTSSKDKKS